MPVTQILEVNLAERPMPQDWQPPEALRAAVYTARIARADTFCTLVGEHYGHTSFHPQDWPAERTWGFTCGCGETELEVKLPIADLRHMDAQDMYVLYERFCPLIERYRNHVQKQKSKTPSLKRAKNLLHKHLNRDQIRELKHCKEFTVIGKDGKEYLITEGSCNNVRLVENGVKTKLFCIVFQNHKALPMYDLMLVQKLLLENNPEEFWKTSNITNINQESLNIGELTNERIVDLAANLQIIRERMQQAS